MTNTEIIQAIKAEIESLKSIEYPCDNSQQATGFFNALDRMTDFLSTLEEKSEIPNDLEEAAKKHFKQEWNENYWAFEGDVINTFIAGAEWQAGQLLKSSPLPKDAVLFNKGVEEGKRLMMEEAVEGTVMDFSSNRPRPQVAVLLDPHKYHTGDKVRVIIVKE